MTVLSSGMELAQEIILTPTFSELRSWFENIPDLMEDSLPGVYMSGSSAFIPDSVFVSSALLESNEVVTFQNVHYQIEQQLWTSANVYIGTDHIRIASVRCLTYIYPPCLYVYPVHQVTPEKLHGDYVAYLVEVIHLRDVDDVFRGANQQRITLRQYHRRPIMMFEIATRDPLLKVYWIVDPD